MRSETSKCPHADIRFCPLYNASHTALGGGCDDGRLAEGDCAVSRGLVYRHALDALSVRQFQLVAELEFAERREVMRQQNVRNLRLNGIH